MLAQHKIDLGIPFASSYSVAGFVSKVACRGEMEGLCACPDPGTCPQCLSAVTLLAQLSSEWEWFVKEGLDPSWCSPSMTQLVRGLGLLFFFFLQWGSGRPPQGIPGVSPSSQATFSQQGCPDITHTALCSGRSGGPSSVLATPSAGSTVP